MISTPTLANDSVSRASAPDDGVLGDDTLPKSVLLRPAHEGLRIVALHWMSKLVDASTAWKQSPTSEALDEASRALRALRITVREGRGLLDPATIKRMNQSLQSLHKRIRHQSLGRAAHALLAAEQPWLSEDAQAEADGLALHVQSAKKGRRVGRAFLRRLDRLVVRMARQLRRGFPLRAQRVSGNGRGSARRALVAALTNGSAPFYGGHLATALERRTDTLAKALTDLTQASPKGRATRSTLRRLRKELARQQALLAPFAHAHPDVRTWQQWTAELHQQLSTIRAAKRVARVARREKLHALRKAMQHVASTRTARVMESCAADGDRLMQALAAAASALRATEIRATAIPVARAVEHDAATGFGHDAATGFGHDAATGLPLEIERKFLLHGLPPEAALAPSIRIEQGWIPGTVIRERLRRTTLPNGTEHGTRTIKLGDRVARIEVEEPVEPGLFAQLWPLTVGARIRKRRHLVDEGTLTWEVDVFLDRDLVLAEVELTRVDQEFTVPSWLAPFIVREVTTEPAYFNSVMAQQDPSPNATALPPLPPLPTLPTW